MSYGDYAKLSVLLGKTLTSVENIDGEVLRFTTSDGAVYDLYHDQDCCESVRIEDITGNLSDLVGSPITLADESSSEEWLSDKPRRDYLDSFTWTFYRFATVKGYVDVRWVGESNGYYGEGVSFRKAS